MEELHQEQVFSTEILNGSKTSARSSVFSAGVGLIVTITNAFLQILMIYWILGAFGTQFNGFIRVSIALSIAGGTSEGALGITTVVLMAKPILEKDWISANEVYSTSKRQYKTKMWKNLFLVLIISIAYPLFIALSSTIEAGGKPMWNIETSNGNFVHVWQLGFICLFFGFRQVISSAIFGIYENILEADKQNYLRRTIILFTDIIVYMSILIMLNLTYNPLGNDIKTMYIAPVIAFLPMLAYPFIRGFLIRFYVLKKYKWIKFYSDFNDYKLMRNSNKMFFSSITLNVLMNFDIFILFIILGSSGLKVSSMMSIYMIIALNIRLMMLTFITSFREYFLLVILKEGRLSWKNYVNYEMYTYIIAAFNFIVMALSTQFLSSGLYGNVLTNETFATAAEAHALKFIFSNKLFSILFAASTSAIIIIQGQFMLIEAKGTANKIVKATNIIVFIYVSLTILLLYLITLTSIIDTSNDQWMIKVITGFYIMKLFFSGIIYFTLWFYTWKYVTYNSGIKGVTTNLIFMLTPMTIVIVFMYTGLDKVAKLDITIVDKVVKIEPISVKTLIAMFSIVTFMSLPLCFLLPILFKPKTGISIILNIPIVKKLLEKQKVSLKLKRFAQVGLDYQQQSKSNEEFINELYNNLKVQNAKNVFELDEEISHSNSKYQFQNNPKIYTVKSSNKKKNQS
ncbi:hypothetical protein EELLY_v1c03450 [Entomoplasma ellychniae]|uniref:Uncharacterized protein n=1 Tax=Entomoplasma ellychniae TaxID=2114 RepID=A0A8E2UAR3_9MOLU|nr:hypothetical protein [Entomoplasma ellychniae]PPE04665.1 hypothetical protein EELLY_v1c03450 [Entomoplasma ellychniae]